MCDFSDMNKIIKVSFWRDEHSYNILDKISKLDYKSDDDLLSNTENSESEYFPEKSESEYFPETESETESIISETESESIISEQKNSDSDSDTAKFFPTS